MNRNPRGNGQAAAEDEYFRREDARRLEQLSADNQPRDPLELALGINDSVVLRRLSALGINADNALALRLFPLFAVAWSDGRMDALEVRALLAEAEVAGISEPSAAHELIKSWTRNKPDPDFEEAWKIYARTLNAKLGERAMISLRASLLRRARCVAEASGGLAGLGAVSRRERRILDTLSHALGGG